MDPDKMYTSEELKELSDAGKLCRGHVLFGREWETMDQESFSKAYREKVTPRNPSRFTLPVRKVDLKAEYERFSRAIRYYKGLGEDLHVTLEKVEPLGMPRMVTPFLDPAQQRVSLGESDE